MLHSDKLEKQNSKLKRRVLALETELGREHSSKAAVEEEQEFLSGVEYDQARNRSVGKSVTMVMLSTIILGAFLTFLTNNRQPVIKAKSWKLLEKIVIVFVVVLWAEVLDDIFVWWGITIHHETLISAFHAVIVFALLVFFAVKAARRNDEGRALEVISAVGVHYYAFMALHGAEHLQETFFAKHIWLCFLGIPIVFLIFAGFSYLSTWMIMRRLPDEDTDHFVDKIEELEDDAHGMVLAFLVTMLVRFAISGTFDIHGDVETIEHTSEARLAMLAYACLMVAVAIVFLPRLHHVGLVLQGFAGGYLAQRAMLIMNPFLCTSVSWSFILWADWEFYEHLFHGDPLLGRIVWAMVCSIGALVAVVVFAVYRQRQRAADSGFEKEDDTVNLAWRWHDLEERKNALNAVAVLIAFSWAEVLITAVDGSMAGSRRAWCFGVLALISVPVTATGYFLYDRYISPAVFASQEAEEQRQ